LVAALNGRLPRDIRVLSARYVPLTFDARKDARSKIYRYQVYTGPVQPPHLRREFFHYPFPLRIPEMEQAAARFAGTHDFASFAKSPPGPDTVRKILNCGLKKRGRRLFLTVEGSGFLHHMVRNMAGTLLEVGRGSMSLGDFERLFAARDRNLAGFTAPAHGLILLKVKY
jgi:tRNA pseudouridine38-40 synthase